MKLTDKKAISIYKRLKCYDLVESIDSYPEDERDGRSDLQFLADEISYYRSCFEEDGHCFNDDLQNSKDLLRETKNGKVISLDIHTFKSKRGYTPIDIERAKETIQEYDQLKRYDKKLRDLGYYGSY